VGLETAIGFACEILRIELSDVWITDETGQLVADRSVIAEYAEETDDA